MKIVKVTVDSGITNTKATIKKSNGELIKFIMPTTLRPATDGVLLADKSSYKVKIDGKEYIVGEHKEKKAVEQSADKANDIHRITTLTAIFNLLNLAELEDIDKVVVALNIPFGLYVNEKEHIKMANIYNKQATEIEVNDDLKVFDVEIVLYPEGAGLAFKNSELLGTSENPKEKLHVLMLGSIHWAVLTFDEEGNPVFSQCHLEENGTLYLVNDLKKALYTKNYEKYDRATLEGIIDKRKRYMRPHDYEIAENLAETYLKEIRDVAHDNTILFDRSKTLIGGGGAILLKEYIRKTFQMGMTTIDTDPVFGDAIGAIDFLN